MELVMYPSVVSVNPLPDYCLLLVFDNQEKRTLNMKTFLDKGVFQELRNEAIFRTVRVNFDTIEWSNGADLDPEYLYVNSAVMKWEANMIFPAAFEESITKLTERDIQ
jgi:hypothetical protein